MRSLRGAANRLPLCVASTDDMTIGHLPVSSLTVSQIS